MQMQQKAARQNNTLTMRLTESEKDVLTSMALEQNIEPEKLVRDLVFRSGLINYHECEAT